MDLKKIGIILIILSYGLGAQFSGNEQPLNNTELEIPHQEFLLKNDYNTPEFKWNKKNTIGTTLMISFGALAYYFQDRADDNYSKYLEAENISEMNKYYDETKKFDRYSRISYIGIEIGFCFNVWSLIEDK